MPTDRVRAWAKTHERGASVIYGVYAAGATFFLLCVIATFGFVLSSFAGPIVSSPLDVALLEFYYAHTVPFSMDVVWPDSGVVPRLEDQTLPDRVLWFWMVVFNLFFAGGYLVKAREITEWPTGATVGASVVLGYAPVVLLTLGAVRANLVQLDVPKTAPQQPPSLLLFVPAVLLLPTVFGALGGAIAAKSG